MDTYDVSGLAEYEELMKRQKHTLEAARARQGEAPKDRRSRQQLVDTFMMQYTMHKLRELQPSNQFQLHSSFVPPPYLPSIAPLEKLKQLFIKDLRLETHHRGKYLLLQSITPPNRMTAIMAIMEDEKTDVVMLQLYQQPVEKDRPATESLNERDVVLIKEPYFKIMGDGEYGLRVDHVSDIIRIEENDGKIPLQWRKRIMNLDKTANDWKLEGNDAMKREQYWSAVISYNEGLRRSASNQESNTIRLNRALAYLKIHQFDAALTDTQYLSSVSEAVEKRLYRAAQALYRLERYQECQDILTKLCERFPGNADAAAELKRARCRVTETQTGAYDFECIYIELSELRPPCLDHATFVGPVVIKASPGRGRGLFTREAFKAGTLLLCEKAFAHCYANMAESETNLANITILMNPETSRMVIGTQADLITTTVQKLWRNPSLRTDFTSLHHGSYEPLDLTDVDNTPIIDTFLVDRIISLNAFGCPLSSLEGHHKSAKDHEADKLQHHSTGIWPKASYINHSCLSNVRRSFIGDLQLVHTTRDLPADTELVFWYHCPDGGSYQETQKKLQNWCFTCDCAICLDLKKTPEKLLKRRNTLLRDLKEVLKGPGKVDLAKAERLLAAAEQTYKFPPSKVPRLRLWDPYLLMTRLYAAQNNPPKVVALGLKVLNCLGFVIKGANIPVLPTVQFEIMQWGLMVDGVLETWLHLWTAYAIVAPSLYQKMEENAKLAYKMCVGEDVTFEKSYGKDIKNVFQC